MDDAIAHHRNPFLTICTRFWISKLVSLSLLKTLSKCVTDKQQTYISTRLWIDRNAAACIFLMASLCDSSLQQTDNR